MYKKNLWRSVIAGTLALAMTLTPVGTTYANAAVPTETTTEADSSTESTTEETTEMDSNTEDVTEATATEISSTEDASNEENTTKSPADTYDTINFSELTDTTELDADMANEIPITAKYFPDETFRECISDSFDSDNDGILSANEINNCTSINFTNRNITSLDGIQYFTQLKSLDCYSNNLTSLDLSKNTKLTYIRCSKNKLTNLILDQNSQLTYLNCSNNRLKNLDISKNIHLEKLYVYNNQLTSLDVSTNSQLTILYCSGTQLKNLDISKNTKLSSLYIEYTDLSNLNIDKNSQLTSLYCGFNQLTTLNVSKNTKLTTLDCSSNKLSQLDVSNNTQLTDLYCSQNQLKDLILGKNTKLTTLWCSNNELTSIDVNNCTQLESFECFSNKLSSLDVSNCKALTYLRCYKNQLQKLDTSQNTQLVSLECNNNQLTSINIDGCTQLVYLTLDKNQLTNLNVYNCPQITSLTCSYNQLTSLNTSQNNKLQNLDCSNNRLSYLDLNQNINLHTFICNNNTYTTKLNTNGQLNLSTITGFQASKVSNLKGGKISGTILTFNNDVDTVTYTYNCGNGYSETFTIKGLKLVTTLSLDKVNINLVKGKTLQLTAIMAPSNATNKSVTWTSSNVKIATVTSTGKVMARTAGTAIITCTTNDGSNIKATCKVTVKNPPSSTTKVTRITLNKKDASLERGKTVQLKATVTPTNATNKAVTWKSSNTKVATVSSNGKVTAKAAGTAIITCTAKDGSGKKATCTIKVYSNTESYVARIYTKALNRNPEASGLKYWTDEINAKRKTPVQVAESFFFAPEFTNKKLNNTEYVKVLYRTFMGREYDQGGLDYWVGRLNRGESRKTVLKSFADCPEFQKIVKSFGL